MDRRQFLGTLAVTGAFVVGAVYLGAAGSTSTTSSTTTSTSGGTALNVQAASESLSAGWNPSINLVAQGNVSKGSPGLFIWGNGNTATLSNGLAIPLNQLYEPNENIKNAYVFVEYPPSRDSQMGQKVLNSLASIQNAPYMPPQSGAGIPFHRSWNDESMVGYIIDYSKSDNTNICFDGPPLYTLSNGTQIAVAGACQVQIPYIGSFLPPDMIVSDGQGYSQSGIGKTLYQAFNFYLRGRTDIALQNLNSVTTHAFKNPDGSVGFGDPTQASRGIFLGAVLHAARTMQVTPTFSGGVTLADVETTLAGIQQPDGSIARNYTSFTSKANGDNETTNVGALAYCSKLQASLRLLAVSRKYDLTTAPSVTYSQ